MNTTDTINEMNNSTENNATDSHDKNHENLNAEEAAQQPTPTPTVVSKRPWSLSAIELRIPSENDATKSRSVWATSVIDANGNMVCYGDMANMQLIVGLENAANGILGDLGAIKHFVERSMEQMYKLS